MMAEKDLDLDLFAADILGEADKINKIIRRGFLKITKDGRQPSQDVETELDLEVAYHWRRFLSGKYPFVDLDTEEEETRLQRGSTYLVRCDSIDGSKHVKAGIDFFGSTLALTREGRVVFAMVLNPLSGKIYHAVEGRGAFLNDWPIRVSALSISQAFVFGELPAANFCQRDESLYENKLEMFNRVLANVFRLRLFGVSSLAIGWVAEGAAAAFIDLSGTTKLYDLEAAVFIAQAAGAVVSDLEGNEVDWGRNAEAYGKKRMKIDLLVANPTAHREMLEVIRG
jgi:myo-inositol-1(or 4)-monophosphatase